MSAPRQCLWVPIRSSLMPDSKVYTTVCTTVSVPDKSLGTRQCLMRSRMACRHQQLRHAIAQQTHYRYCCSLMRSWHAYPEVGKFSMHLDGRREPEKLQCLHCSRPLGLRLRLARHCLLEAKAAADSLHASALSVECFCPGHAWTFSGQQPCGLQMMA